MLARFLPPLLGLLASTSALSAQSSVWKVTRHGQSLYLGGTCHVLRASDFPLPAEFDQAFAASSTLFFETDVSRMRSAELQQVVMMKGIFTDGRSLDKVISPAAWQAVQSYCAETGVPVAQVRRFQPWMFVVMMAALELQKLGVTSEGVDLHYFNKAADAGKRTGELETFERHLEFLTTLGAGHESEMIEKSIEELSETPAKLEQLLAAWKTGNVAALDELMLREMREKYPTVFKSLLVDRNNAWVPKIDELIRTPEVEFVLVGAAHLAGKEGLLAQLRARGCRIEQLKAAPASPAKKKK